MREFRLVYNSPCRTDRLGKPGNVLGRIHVRVQPCSARTGEAMPLPVSDRPASRTRLARVGRFHEDHAQPARFGLVGDKVLQLPEGPTVQPCPNPLSGLDVGPDVGQVFQADFACTDAKRLLDDGFAGLVVDVADTPFLAPGDSLELALSGAATIGLKASAMGKVDIPLVAEVSAAPDLASAGGGEIVFSNVHAEHATARGGRGIRQIEDQVEIPDTLTEDEARFLGGAARQQIALVLAGSKGNLDAARQGEQREPIALERIGALVEVDRGWPKDDRGDRLVFGDPLVGLERLVGVRNPVDRLADHLTAQRRKALAHCVVGQVVQSDAVPAAMLLDEGNDGVTGLGIGSCERSQRRCLFRRSQQFEGYRAFIHIGGHHRAMRRKSKDWQPFRPPAIPPRPESRGFSGRYR